MLNAFRQRHPGASLRRLLWWEFVRGLMWIHYKIFYRAKVWGSQKIPATGSVLLICNHQSFLDPPLIGMGISHRHFYSFARATLFRNWLFGAYIRSINSIPIDQEKLDVKGLRQAISLLKEEQMLLVFPEGKRTSDGALHEFQEGVQLMIRRAKPLVVPAALEGPYDLWPITRRLPRLFGRTGLMFGDPIPAQTLLDMGPEDASVYMQQRVEELRLKVRTNLREESNGDFPAAGPGDEPSLPLGDAG